MKKWFKNDSGATAIEYSLIAGAMGLALLAVMPTLGDSLGAKMVEVNAAVASVN